jgi:hypothetical protein
LPTEGGDLWSKGYLGIPLRELLEGEASMAEYLSSNRAGGIDFHHHMSHLKGRPVLMGNEVFDQSLVIRIILILRVRDPGTVSNKLFCFRSD